MLRMIGKITQSEEWGADRKREKERYKEGERDRENGPPVTAFPVAARDVLFPDLATRWSV